MKTLLMILMLLTPAAAQASRAQDLYQQALVAERGAGDLKRAIALYEQVVAGAGSDRQLAARALVQVGRAYEILGNAEAKKAYQRVVDEFGDQRTEVAAARSRLASLDAERAPRRGPASRLVLDFVHDTDGQVSDDGTLFSFVDWNTGDMAVRDLRRGVDRRVTNKGEWSESPEFGGASRISPDAKWLVYTWYDERSNVDLRLIRLDGSTPRILYREPSVAYVAAGAFSPDGKRIVAGIERRDRSTELAVIDLADGEVTTLARFDASFPQPRAFSPDGRWILFHVSPQGKGGPSDVFVIPAAGGKARAVAPHPAQDRAAGFTPDGKTIIFVSWRSGDPSLWAVDFDRAGNDGEPRLLHPHVGSGLPLGLTRDGAFFYEVRRGSHEGYLLDLDAEGKPRGTPRRLGDAVGADRFPNFSPDGRQLLYLSSRGAGNPMHPREPLFVFRDLQSGAERTLRAAVSPHFQGLSWSPDGRSIAIAGWRAGQWALHLLDVESGQFAPIERVKEDMRQFFPTWSPDGAHLYYLDAENGERLIKRRDITTGDVQTIFSAGRESLQALSISPDGKWLAFRRKPGIKNEDDWIQIVPAAGGDPVDVLREPVRNNCSFSLQPGILWTPDGRHILFGRWTGWSMENQTVEVYRAPVAGGGSHKIGLSMPRIWAMRLSPDGRTLGFTAGEQTSELWALEDFLAAEGGK